MTRTTDDPVFARLAQTALEDQGLYQGALDGAWGPVSDLAYQVYANYERYADAGAVEVSLNADQQADLAKFLKLWKTAEAQAKYLAVAVAANIPAELVAALHWRESGGDFSTYLQNGDLLGEPTVHEPAGLLYHEWTTAAIAAIEAETAAREQSGIEEESRNLPCLCIFAEYYNGEGYRDRGVPDPYVLSGTSGYKAGKFSADDVYDPNEIDAQIGVLVMLRALGAGGSGL